MRTPRYPSLYQINTRVWLTELARSLDRPATLDDLPDAELDHPWVEDHPEYFVAGTEPDLARRLYLDVPPWGYNAFELTVA